MSRLPNTFLLEQPTALNGDSLKQETEEERTPEQPNEVVFVLWGRFPQGLEKCLEKKHRWPLKSPKSPSWTADCDTGKREVALTGESAIAE